jgi:DNA-binding response OmpR family regulator
MRDKVVVIIEDELPLMRTIAEWLEFEGMKVYKVFKSVDALPTIQRIRPDGVILDLMLEGGKAQAGEEGVDILRAIRDDKALEKTPVIVYSIKMDQPEQWQRLMRLGVDHALSKAQSIPELLAALDNAIRRTIKEQRPMRKKRLYPLDYDRASDVVYKNGMPTKVDLTPQDRKMLIYLIDNCNRFCTSDMIIDNVLHDAQGSEETVQRAISRLRYALVDKRPFRLIELRQGLGYRLVVAREEWLD